MVLDGKVCSQNLREQIKQEVKLLKTKPKIIDIQIGNNSASDIYIANKEKAAHEVGMEFECFRFSEDVKEEIIINKIKELNNDNNIHGILVQMPIPDCFDYKKIINTISPIKDVDGLTYINAGKLINDEPCLVSCTPAGILELLKYYNIPIIKKHVVIVGRSILVGKPLIQLLLKENATVTICHSKTVDLENYTKQADILIVAVGKKHLIKENMVKEDTVVIDVGINRVDNKIYGDVDFDGLKDKTIISPVPGGVGPMTVTMLLYNVLKSYKEMN